MIKALRTSPLVQRLAALTLFVLTVMFTWQLSGGLYVARLQNMNRSIADTQNTIARFAHLGAEHENLKGARDALLEDSSLANGLFEGRDAGRATATLQSLIKEIVTQNGGSIIRLSPLPVAKEPPYKRISIKIEINADMGALATILSDVSNATPLMFVDSLHIRTASQAIAQSDTAQKVRITLSVYGYVGAGDA